MIRIKLPTISQNKLCKGQTMMEKTMSIWWILSILFKFAWCTVVCEASLDDSIAWKVPKSTFFCPSHSLGAFYDRTGRFYFSRYFIKYFHLTELFNGIIIMRLYVNLTKCNNITMEDNDVCIPISLANSASSLMSFGVVFFLSRYQTVFYSLLTVP